MRFRKILIVLFSSISILCFGIAFTNIFIQSDNFMEKESYDALSSHSNRMMEDHLTKNVEEQPQFKPDLSKLNLYSSSLLLANLDENEILFEKNSQKTIYPASLTKIMTSIVAIEHLPSLEESISVSETIFPYLVEQNASIAGFFPNEKARAIDLLYGVMLPSGADASIALAKHIAGSEAEFVKLMNEKAKELQMNHTHFINVTGLHDPDHYSTVEDLYLLLKYALSNPVFREIFTTDIYATPPTNFHPEGLTFHSTMFAKLENPILENGRILGGKTGFTDEAGLCLASLAIIDGSYYVLVSAGADGNLQTEPFHILDALTIYHELSKQIRYYKIHSLDTFGEDT